MHKQGFSSLKDLYHFRGFHAHDLFLTKDAIRVSLRRTGKTGVCPKCGKKRRKKEEEYEREVRDLDVAGRKVTLYFPQYKIHCTHCGYRGMEELDFVDEYSRCTVRFEEYVAALCERMSLKGAAGIAGIHWEAAKRIDKKYMRKRLEGLELTSPTRIGVDEVAYARRHKYLTVVRDVDASRVIWVGEGRRKETLDEFFRNFLGSAKTARIRLAVIDMWDPYIASVRESCPVAEIVFDKFHIAKKANEALDCVRKQEFADACRDERRRMKHKRFLILRRNDALDDEQREDVDCLMKRNKTLYKSYLLKEQLSSILDEPRLDVAVGRLGRWFRNVKKAGIPQFEKLVKTFRNYLYGILNYFKHRVTNAASEAFNNKIGLLKRIAYGFHDLEYFKLKIICCCWKNSS